MSSDQEKKSSNNDNQKSTGDKQIPAAGDAGSKSADSQKAPSSGGHEETGPEKFVSMGGSGGVPIRGGQGYEALADH